MKGNWKTSLGGILGGLLLMAGPQVGARLSGDIAAPPITSERMIMAAAIAYLGWQSKDKDVTGGKRDNTIQ